MDILQGVWKQRLRPCAVVGYGVKIVLASPPNYVTRSPGYCGEHLVESYCKKSKISDSNWLRYLFSSYLNKIWLSV